VKHIGVNNPHHSLVVSLFCIAAAVASPQTETNNRALTPEIQAEIVEEPIGKQPQAKLAHRKAWSPNDRLLTEPL
jgi:hypothetical protein